MRPFCLALLLFSPTLALAACSEQGATVVYVNGVFTTEEQARSDASSMWRKYFLKTGDGDVKFINGYNESHLAGAGDLVQSAVQILGGSMSNYDLNTILLQIHPQVTTRKLLLVGHSQGTFYTNAMWDYLLDHGEPHEAVGVYNIATPATFVAGNGRYLNSTNDSLLNMVEERSGILGLRRNITISLADADKNSSWPGHGISQSYLAGAPQRVVQDMRESIAKLEAKFASDQGDCFTPPDISWGHKAQGTLLAASEPIAQGLKTGGQLAYGGAKLAWKGISMAAAGAIALGQKVAGDIDITLGGLAGLSHAAEPENRGTNFEIFKRLYGSSLSREDYEELLGIKQGAAVALAFEEEPAMPEPLVIEPAPPEPVPELKPASAPEPAPAVEAPTVPINPAPNVTSGGGSPSVPANLEQIVEESLAAASSSPQAPNPAPTPTPTATAAITVPFEDAFDTYAGWNAYGSNVRDFVFDDGTGGGCHNSACINTGTAFTSSIPRIYKTGTGVAGGAVALWAKYKVGFLGFGNTLLQVCVGMPDNGSSNCETKVGFTPNDDTWHRYVFAWRDGTTAKQFCLLRDSTDQTSCSWADSSAIALGASVDTIVFAVQNAGRPDQGDIFWVDDISAAP